MSHLFLIKSSLDACDAQSSDRSVWLIIGRKFMKNLGFIRIKQIYRPKITKSIDDLN